MVALAPPPGCSVENRLKGSKGGRQIVKPPLRSPGKSVVALSSGGRGEKRARIQGLTCSSKLSIRGPRSPLVGRQMLMAPTSPWHLVPCPFCPQLPSPHRLVEEAGGFRGEVMGICLGIWGPPWTENLFLPAVIWLQAVVLFRCLLSQAEAQDLGVASCVRGSVQMFSTAFCWDFTRPISRTRYICRAHGNMKMQGPLH